MHSGSSFVFKTMASNYDNTILKVLAEAGHSGMSVQKVARHVFNASNSFFEPVSYDDIRRYVQQYVLRNSKGTDALLLNIGQRGIYKINPNSAQSQQLMLMFSDDEDEEAEKRNDEDLSLSLF
jgi:hypothetical protein